MVGTEEVTGVVIEIGRDVLRDAPHLPMYEPVVITAVDKKVIYGVRPDGSIWISVGDPDYRHAQCDTDLPEWALHQLGAIKKS